MPQMTSAQGELHARAGAWLRAAFGDVVAENADEPAYFVGLGAIGVRIDIAAIGDGDALLEAYSWIAHELPVTPDIGLYLAQRNAELRFGALSIDGDGAIILGDALFADGAGEIVLARLVTVLAETAEVLDEELRQRFADLR
jgi:hypothetical protein